MLFRSVTNKVNLGENKKVREPLRFLDFFGGDCWTRTSDLLRVNYNRFEYIGTEANKNNNICCDFATFRRAILQGLALAPVGN